ncbi:MAG: sugar phosphate isomerase/epimerase family protein [Candidatus Thorarchaeota archaeon]
MFVSCSILGGIKSSSTPEVLLSNLIRTMVRVKDAGYDTAELYYSNLPDWVGNTIQAALDDLKLKAYSIHLPKFLTLFDKKDFDETISSAFSFIKACELKVAVLHLPDQDQLTGPQWERRFEILLKAAENSGCMLTLENVPYIKDVDHVILDEIGKRNNRPLGITIDMEFMYINGSSIEWMTDVFNGKIGNVHFRDSDGSLIGEDGYRQYIVPGEGKMDLHQVVKVLHLSGYRGPLTIEVSHRQKRNIIDAKKYAEDCLANM